jgi:hypothetical protein
MNQFKFGDYVWYNKEGWIYLGFDIDGGLNLCRPIYAHPYDILEFTQLEIDDLNQFLVENGAEQIKPKGTK